MSNSEPIATDSLQEESHIEDSVDQGEDLEQVSTSQEAKTETPGEADQLEADQLKEETEEQLEQLKAEAAEYLDGWQRARAEFANYKKRVEAERKELRRASNEALLLKLLPVVDDFERAYQTLPDSLEDEPWVSGTKMILRKLQTILESEGVSPIDSTGHPFDPQWHEAVLQEETVEHPDGYVMDEMQRGYKLGDRVLRPAMVKVASNSNESGDDEN